MGSKLLSEVKTWASELWQSFNHGGDSELFMPAVGGPEGDPVYDTAAIEHEVSNVRASMSMSTHTVAPSSYTATLATAGLGVDPQHVITATRTEVLKSPLQVKDLYSSYSLTTCWESRLPNSRMLLELCGNGARTSVLPKSPGNAKQMRWKISR